MEASEERAEEQQLTDSPPDRRGTPPSFRGTLRDVGFASVCVALMDLVLQGALSTSWKLLLPNDALAVVRPGPFVPYAAHLFLLTVAALVVHLAPVVALVRWLGRRLGREAWVTSVAMALYGFSWQATISGGTGLRAHPNYESIRLAFVILVPLAFLLGTKLLLGLLPRHPKLLALGVPLVFVLGSCTLSVLKYYRGFHAHLVVLLVLSIVLALSVRPAPSWVMRGAAGIAVSMTVVFIGTLSERVLLMGRVLRYSYAASPVLSRLPLSRALILPADMVVDPDSALRPSNHPLTPPTPARKSLDPVASNVILIVLEATRWDFWADPRVAPRFHGLRRNGTYFPRAVAVYPATPLAYGALFVGQPPSVLLATGCWSHERPFDAIRDQFDVLSLSQPDARWFDGSTVTDFFVPASVPVARHRNARQALSTIQAAIESSNGRPFFAWAHLYEPHAPYASHAGHYFGTRLRDYYKSELALLDAELGRFVDWFRERPEHEQTLLVIVADHGEGVDEQTEEGPIEFHNFDVRNVLTAIPLYIEGPAVPADRVEQELVVSQLDVMPTIFEALGVPVPERFMIQGRSIYQLLAQRPRREVVIEQFQLDGEAFQKLVNNTTILTPSERRARFRDLSVDPFTASKIALRYGRWKLNYDRLLRRYQLYDVAADPHEHRDLSASHPHELRDLQQRLRRWLEKQVRIIRRLSSSRR